MLVAKRDSVLRINLNDFSRVETLPLGKVRSVIAMDFHVKNNCIFWSDVTTDHIMVLDFSPMQIYMSSEISFFRGTFFISDCIWMDKVCQKF